MTEYKKFCKFEYKNNFEKLFISILREKANPDTSYLSLPSSSCFTGCIKEILNCLKKERDGIINSDNSNHLIANMYSWMSNETLIREYDYLLYSQLLQTLKSYSEGQKVSKTEKYAFFEYLNKSKTYKYTLKLYDKIIELYEKDVCDETSYKYINIFINELLSDGINYSFLWFIYNCYIDNKFSDFKSFVEYLFYGNKDTYDVFIPIENFSTSDNEIFAKKRQKIEKIGDKFYCKVYANNTIDFHFLIKENIVRIESLFNILRFYQNSSIRFSFSLPIIIKSKYFSQEFEILMSDILCYRSKSYGKNFLIGSVEALEKVKDEDKNSYHRLLNVISYAEKDQDIINPSSYVDNWISLETLISMGERGKGYDAVSNIIPKMLSAKFIFDDACQKYRDIRIALSRKNINVENLEDFIKKSNQSADFVKQIEDPYVRITATLLSKQFSSVYNLKQLFETVEKELSIDLLRIYILRNEYVHSSNLQAFSSMHPYKLKHILSASIDEFFRMLSNRISRDVSDYGIVFDAFSEIIYKYDVRITAFTSLLERKKYLNSSVVVHTDIEDLNIPLETFVYNVLKSNSGLFRKYDVDIS